MRLEDLRGRQIGRYEVVGLLGRGGMAAVYRAHDTVLRRDVALKVLYPQYGADEALIERFKREAILAARLDHPNIVPIYDVGEAEGLIYIAMKLLQGRSLADLLAEQGRMSLDDLVPIVVQIAAALDYAHARGVIHRDIKAANILLEPQHRAILTDFGIAKSLDAPGLTSTGVLIGTPDYMAPEQIGNRDVDGRVDVYALGVLVFRALTGRRPFEGSTQDVLLGHLSGHVPDPSMIEPSLPPSIDPVIQKALARDPGQRYASAGEFARALQHTAGYDPATPPPALRRPADARVVVPRVASEQLAQQAGADEPTRKGTIAPPGVVSPRPPRLERVVAPAPEPRRSMPIWPLVLILLVLVVGAALLLPDLLTGRSGQRPPPDSGVPLDPTQPLESPPPTAMPPATPAPELPTEVPATVVPVDPTATPAPVEEPTEVSPSATPTPELPTPTEPPPVLTPSPLPPTATPSPTPCPVPLTGGFGALWENNLEISRRIGCPILPESGGDIAEQPFERGSMFWYGPLDTIYLLEGFQAGTWRAFPPGRQAGDDPPPAAEPPEGLLAPVSGFGLVWNTHANVRQALGWATAFEAGYAGAYQPFDGGLMLFSPEGLGRGKTIYVLYDDGRFERYDDPNQ